MAVDAESPFVFRAVIAPTLQNGLLLVRTEHLSPAQRARRYFLGRRQMPAQMWLTLWEELPQIINNLASSFEREHPAGVDHVDFVVFRDLAAFEKVAHMPTDRESLFGGVYLYLAPLTLH